MRVGMRHESRHSNLVSWSVSSGSFRTRRLPCEHVSLVTARKDTQEAWPPHPPPDGPGRPCRSFSPVESRLGHKIPGVRGSSESKLVCCHDGVTPICAAAPRSTERRSHRRRRRGRQAGEEVTSEGQDKLKTADQVGSHAGNPHFSIPCLATGLLLLNANLIMLQNSS